MKHLVCHSSSNCSTSLPWETRSLGNLIYSNQWLLLAIYTVLEAGHCFPVVLTSRVKSGCNCRRIGFAALRIILWRGVLLLASSAWSTCRSELLVWGKFPVPPGTSVPGRSPDITTVPLLEVIQLLKYFCNFSQGLVCPYPGEREWKVLFKRKGTEGSFLFHWVGSGEFNISVFWE